MKTIDDILDEKICTGPYQYIIFIVVSLLDFCNGIVYICMSILLSILQNVWGLNQNQMVVLSSISFFGSGFGNYIYAYITDAIGRKTTLIIISSLSFITLIYTSILNSFIQMLITRFIFGAVYNIVQPIAFMYVLESVEQKYRGRFGGAITISLVLGKLYFLFLCFIFLDDYASGNWRNLLRFCSIPAGIAFLLTVFCLQETIRFSLFKGRYRQAFHQINVAIIANKNQELIEDQEKDGLIQWMNNMKQNDQQSHVQFSGLFSKNYLKYTIRLWIIYIGANFLNLIIFLLVPLLLNSAGQGFESMLYIFLTELATLIVLNFIIDTKKGGRVNIILFASFLNTFSNALIFLKQEKFLLPGMIIMIIGNRATFSTTNILACESYASNYRALGVGYGQFIGALPGIIGPYIIFQLYAIDPYLPFLLIAVIQFLQFLTLLIIRDDKTQKPLE